MHRLRSATGVLVLSTALLIGSANAAVSSADSGAGDSTSDSSASSDSTAGESASNASQSDAAGASRGSGTAGDTSAAASTNSSLSDDGGFAEAVGADVAPAETDPAEAAPAAVDAASVAAAPDASGQTAPAEGAVESVAAVDDGAVGPEGTGDQSTPGVVSTDTEPAATGASSADSEASATATSGSREPDAGTVAASSTALTSTLTSTAGDSRTSTAGAVTGGPTIRIIDAQPAAKLETSASATPPPTLEEVLSTLTVGMVGTMTTVVVTLGDTVATVAISMGNAAAAIPPTIHGLPTSEAPVADLIKLVEVIMNSVKESATAVMSFPSDLARNLGIPTVGLDGTEVSPGPVVADKADRRLLPSLDAGPVAVGALATAPLAGQLPPVHTVDDFVGRAGFAELSPISLTALAAPIQIAPSPMPALAGQYDSLFDRAFGALLVPLSLWALATGALPGLVGLIVVFGVGARVGYRQAKAGFALSVAGIGRFAGPGPLGVVRSGSLVAVHQRGMRTGGARIPRWALAGDQVA